MTALVLPFAGGLLAALGWWAVIERLVDQPLFCRPNYRAAAVPVAGGLVLILAVLAVAAAHATARGALLISDAEGAESVARTLVVVLGFGFLGLLDDLAGTADVAGGEVRGFAGHLRAAGAGQVSTGALKMVGGLAVAAAAVPVARAGIDAYVRDVALVALSANLANLFDRAPGRAGKVSLVATAVLVAATGTSPLLEGPVAVAGAALGLLAFDLRERLMLGDGGANPLGAAVGLGVVLVAAPSTRLVVLVALVALNAASELVSFSQVIDRVSPLRFLDRLGGRRDRA